MTDPVACERKLFEARWGAPRHIAVVWCGRDRRDRDPQVYLPVFLGIARLGIHVQLFVLGTMRNGEPWMEQGDGGGPVTHANLRLHHFTMAGWLPPWLGRALTMAWCVGYLASYRLKHDAKRFKALIVPEVSSRRFFNAFRWLHGIPVFTSVATCPFVAQEFGSWCGLVPRQERLSVVVITKNEARQIEDCLQTVAWADELVIVDDQSTDQTPQLCARFAATVLSHASHGDFDTQRNLGIDRASGDWILQMDADERVPDALRAELELILRRRPQENGFAIRRNNWFLGQRMQRGGWSNWGLKLFRKDAGRYVGHSVHETLHVEGPSGRCDSPIEHYPYQTLTQVIDRTNFYTSVEARVLFRQHPARHTKDIGYQLIVRPIKIFWKIYVKKQGARDGFIGFLFSVLFAWNHWLTWAKYWELTRQGRAHPGPASDGASSSELLVDR